MNTCPVCCSPFKKPKMLPCLDTICFTCLDEHVIKKGRANRTFPCPVCDIDLPIPDGGISQFDDNQHMKGEKALESVTGARLPCEVL